jgi:hypothetical protein
MAIAAAVFPELVCLCVCRCDAEKDREGRWTEVEKEYTHTIHTYTCTEFSIPGTYYSPTRLDLPLGFCVVEDEVYNTIFDGSRRVHELALGKQTHAVWSYAVEYKV